MRSGLLFKLALRKPNIFLNEKALFGYTFLESECLEEQIKADPQAEQHRLIAEFLKTPFTNADLYKAPFLQDKAQHHLEESARIRESLRNEKDLIIDNIARLAYKNILDVEAWGSVLGDVLDERFQELQAHPQLDEAFKHLENLFSRFDIKNSKFYLDKAELPTLIPLKENMTSLFNAKQRLGSVRLETSIMSFFIKASSKLPVNLERMRLYYKKHLVDDLREVIAKESSIVDLAKLEVTLDALHLATGAVKDAFTRRVKELLSKNEPVHIRDNREYLTIATNWACVGEMREEYRRLFEPTFECLLSDSPAALLQAVVTCHKETPESVDRILGALCSRPFDLLSRKPEIHRVLHILAIRGHDLSKYQEFVDRLCAENCEKLSPSIAQHLTAAPKSQCMQSQEQREVTTFSPNLEHKWISATLRQEFRLQKGLRVFCQTKICRFDVLFGFVKNRRVFVVEIPDLTMVINKARNYRGTIDQKKELFRHYNITILELTLPFKHLSYIVTKRDKHALIKEVRTLI